MQNFGTKDIGDFSKVVEGIKDETIEEVRKLEELVYVEVVQGEEKE